MSDPSTATGSHKHDSCLSCRAFPDETFVHVGDGSREDPFMLLPTDAARTLADIDNLPTARRPERLAVPALHDLRGLRPGYAVVMEDVIAARAIETWTCDGLTCAICPAHGCFSGYVRLPKGRRRIYVQSQDAYPGGPGLSYGPDKFGWIGFDTNNVGDYWAPDDLVGHMSPDGITYANTVRNVAVSAPDTHRWTLEELRRVIERVAKNFATGNQMS